MDSFGSGGTEGRGLEVIISPQVLEVCWAHALSNEHEEIMGLLVGRVRGTRVEFLTLKVLKRSTKKKDRVEIDPMQLTACVDFAASLKDETGEPLRVLGWYHSHPHITVHPSAVDLRTQASYQLMDSNFVGLIFAVFCTNQKTGCETRRVTAFQAERTEEGLEECVNVQIRVEEGLSLLNQQIFVSVYSAMADLWMVLAEEEKEEFNKFQPELVQTDRVAEMNNQAQLTCRLAQIHRRIVQPILLSTELKLQTEMSKANRQQDFEPKLDTSSDLSSEDEDKFCDGSPVF